MTTETKADKLLQLQTERDDALAACRLVHEAAHRGGLYVTRETGPREAACRALDAVRKVLGVAPTEEVLAK